MKEDTMREACEKWVNTFNTVPRWMLDKIDPNGEYITIYDDPSCRDYPDYPQFPMWNTFWEPDDICDVDWVVEHRDKAIECGFTVLEYWDGENDLTLLGIDGAGYTFMEEHFLPLYKARGLQWHSVDDASNYNIGDRVEIVKMDNAYHSIPRGKQGVVIGVEPKPLNKVNLEFDDGSTYNLSLDEYIIRPC